METPVIFLIFNRPDTTARVFAEIAKARPRRLLVVADGPRPHRPDDVEKCAAARAVIERVDWPCEVMTNFADTNMGLKDRVASGLTWGFEQVEEAIVLEDDCVPHPTFFRFCEELLNRYCDDERIMAITGNNFQFGRRRTPYSYYFSRYNHCWGWASWRRAWQHYDHGMCLWPEIRDGDWLYDILQDRSAIRYWRRIFQRTYDNEINSWAYRWTFACWVQSGLTITPDINLVSNIGFRADAAHTVDRWNPRANLPATPMEFPLRHPPFVVRHVEADRYIQKTAFSRPGLGARVVRKLRWMMRPYLQNQAP